MRKQKLLSFYVNQTLRRAGCLTAVCFILLIIVNVVKAEPETKRMLCVGIIACCAVTVAVMALICYQRIKEPLIRMERAIEQISSLTRNGTANIKSQVISDYDEMVSDLESLTETMQSFADREFRTELLLKQSELNALQMQINPHFLYNTLDCIRGIAINNDQIEIEKMTKALSEIFRYSISRSGNLSTVREEIKNVENYMTIQQMRFDNKFVLRMELDNEAELMTAGMPKMTLQPLVENAVFHGLEPKSGTGVLTIRMYLTEKRLIIHVDDDGVGIPGDRLDEIKALLNNENSAAAVESKLGIALKNVHERIRIFYGENFGLDVFSTEGLGTSVIITLPFNDSGTSRLDQI